MARKVGDTLWTIGKRRAIVSRALDDDWKCCKALFNIFLVIWMNKRALLLEISLAHSLCGGDWYVKLIGMIDKCHWERLSTGRRKKTIASAQNSILPFLPLSHSSSAARPIFHLSRRRLRAVLDDRQCYFDLSDVISYAISDPKEVECRLAEFTINQQLYDAKNEWK